MRISSFNINKFCGAYSNPKSNGGYFNPKRLDFVTPIKKIVDSCLNSIYDIIFLQEFYDDNYIKTEEYFKSEGYIVFHNTILIGTIKSHVVGITLKGTSWELVEQKNKIPYQNKFIEMKLEEKSLSIISFHNTDENVKKMINKHFENGEKQIILGDFNDISWIENCSKMKYRDLVTNDMVTFKPAQTAVDRIFVKESCDFSVSFNGVIETYASDHNILTFLIDI